MGTWLNSDGLYVKFGVDEGKLTSGGEFGEAGGGVHLIELDLDATKLSTSANTILSDTVMIPKNYRVEKVEVYVTTAFTSGGSATLDLGTVKVSDRSTEIDANGFVAAAAVASLTNNAKIAGAGALVGAQTSTTDIGLVVAKAGTAAFTAGKAKVRITLNKI